MPLSGDIKKAVGNSSKGRVKERRGRIEITADILSVAREDAKKTQIVYKANLNFKRVEAYLPYLVDKGLIENRGGIYKTTEKGKEFLHNYKKMKELLT